MGLRTKIRRLLASAITEAMDQHARSHMAPAVQLADLPHGKDHNIQVVNQHHALRESHPNPFVRHGKKGFSQADEDGITLEIIRRLGIENGVFAEYGVGDGTENNTIVVRGLGWRGFWMGGEALAFDTAGIEGFIYEKTWITLDNIIEATRSCMASLHTDSINLISLDLDGNDYHFAECLLSHGFRPDVFIVEYNGKLPPPVQFVMPYEAGHEWQRDDYYGASLESFTQLFEHHGYALICCNAATGVNAFFVPQNRLHLFPEAPRETRLLYSSPNFHHHTSHGHKTSPRTVEAIIRRTALPASHVSVTRAAKPQ